MDSGSDADTDRLIALIEERKQVNRDIDELRVKALSLAIDADILDEFPDLKPWYPDARRQGLVHASSWSEPKSPGQLDAIRSEINALLSEVRHKEDLADKLTYEIKHID